MRRMCLGFAVVFTMLATVGMGQQGPYKVLKTAKTGGLGGASTISTRTMPGAGSISRAAPSKVSPRPPRG